MNSIQSEYCSLDLINKASGFFTPITYSNVVTELQTLRSRLRFSALFYFVCVNKQKGPSGSNNGKDAGVGKVLPVIDEIFLSFA